MHIQDCCVSTANYIKTTILSDRPEKFKNKRLNSLKPINSTKNSNLKH